MKPPARVGDPPNPQWNMEKIHALDAWNLFSGNKVNVVAVMDYGIDYTHEDFGSSLSGVAGNLWDRGRIFASYAQRGYDEINYGSATSQPAGATKPAAGDFLGNHAAGIIGALTNNRIGVSGINWFTQLYSSKIVDGTKTPTVGVVKTAVDHIIAMRSSDRAEQLVRAVAFGWSTTTDFGNPMPEFRRLATEGALADPTKGILVTVPAGDSGAQTNYPTWYAPLAGTPASFDNVLIVGATDKDDRPWSKNSNSNRIEIYAPGVSIVSLAAAGSGYTTVDGTRAAAAHVSGAISLIYEAARVNGRTLAWQDVRDAIINGADLVNGIRRLNIMGSLKLLGLDTRPPGSGPILTITGGSAAEGNAGVSLATFTVAMDRVYSAPQTYKVRVGDGTALLVDNDYVAVSPDGSLAVTIPANQKSTTISVRIVGDRRVEPDETISANLIDIPTDVNVTTPTATWTILNDDAFPTVSLAGPSSFVEGNAGTTAARIAVFLSAPIPLPVTVSYDLAAGSATPGSDYVVPASTQVTFAPNQTTQWIPLTIQGDRTAESDETLTINLSNPVNATLGATPSVTVTIVDDDTPVVSIRGGQTAALAGAINRIVFTVSLSTRAVVPVTVNYATLDGTALSGSDYTLASGSLTFAPGEIIKTIVVTLAPRRAGQVYPKSFKVGLSGLSGGKFGPGTDSALGTIL